MIIKVNFVSKEYRNKIINEKMGQIGAVIAIVIVGVILGAVFYMDMMIKKTNEEIAAKEAEMQQIELKIKEIQTQIAGIPDLTDKVNMLNDLFAQSNLRFSEILYNLMKNTPTSVWFNDFSYKDNKISMRGISMSEIAAFSMERNLKDTGFFSTVMQDYIRDIEVNKNPVKEFQYNCELKDLRLLAPIPMTATTTAAVNTK